MALAGADFAPAFSFSSVEAELVHVATKDRTVHPEPQRFVAKRMGATTVEVASSHVAMLSHPDLVLDLIRNSGNSV